MQTNLKDTIAEKLSINHIILSVFLVGIFVGSGGITVINEYTQPSLECYMSSPDGECVVKINQDFPEPYTKHCVTSGNQSNSSACFLTDENTEHFTMFRTDSNGTLHTSRSLNVVGKKLNETGYGTIYVSDFYSQVKNKTKEFDPQVLFRQIERTYQGKINVTECSYKDRKNGGCS